MFQSRSLRSSPGTYLRCSLNSTEKPWNGLACRPARKPSTMNLARRSRRATWRMTSGRRYFSGLLIALPHQQRAVGGVKALAVDLENAGGLPGQELAKVDVPERRPAGGQGNEEQLARADQVLHPGRRVLGVYLEPGGPRVQLIPDAFFAGEVAFDDE